MTTNCFICNKEFRTYPSRIKKGQDKYCSRKCSNPVTLFKLGNRGIWLGKKRPTLIKTEAAKTMFKKGHEPWNKDKPFLQIRGENNPNWDGGKPDCKLCGKQIVRGSNLCVQCNGKTQRGVYNPTWKDEGYSLTAVHNWVKRYLGKPKICEFCKTTKPNTIYQWANKDGQYRKNLADWLRLCIVCHKRYDLVRLGKVVIGR